VPSARSVSIVLGVHQSVRSRPNARDQQESGGEIHGTKGEASSRHAASAKQTGTDKTLLGFLRCFVWLAADVFRRRSTAPRMRRASRTATVQLRDRANQLVAAQVYTIRRW